MELEDVLARLRERLDPLEYAAVLGKYFGQGYEDWQRIQMIGVADKAILTGDELLEYLSERGLKKFHDEIWPD